MYIAGWLQGLKFRGGGLLILGGENLPPLVEIGLTDLPCNRPVKKKIFEGGRLVSVRLWNFKDGGS